MNRDTFVVVKTLEEAVFYRRRTFMDVRAHVSVIFHLDKRIGCHLLGPLGQMIAALTDENPYRALLEAVRDVLTTAYPDLQAALSPLEQMQTHGSVCATTASGCGAIAMGSVGAPPAPVSASLTGTNASALPHSTDVFGEGAEHRVRGGRAPQPQQLITYG